MSTTFLTPREYVELPQIPRDWRVVDIGPGDYPLQRADVYLDHNPDKLAPLAAEGKETICADIEEGLTGIPNGAFDFCFISHVIEHVQDVTKCIATLNRIARSGVAVLPSAMKESLFFFEEPTHYWLVLPNPVTGGPPVFVRHNKGRIQRLRDNECQKIMCRLFRHGTSRNTLDDQYMRDWYAMNEVHLDVVVDWGPSKALEAIVIG